MHYAKLQNMGRRKSPERKRPQKIKTKENYFSSDFKIQLKSLKVFFQPTKNFLQVGVLLFHSKALFAQDSTICDFMTACDLAIGILDVCAILDPYIKSQYWHQ